MALYLRFSAGSAGNKANGGLAGDEWENVKYSISDAPLAIDAAT